MVLAVSEEMGSFARTIVAQKYSREGLESWGDIADRVASNVVGKCIPDQREAAYRLIESRTFLPGGRYLYAAGRPFQQLNNCALFRAKDSKHGWGKILSDACVSLMSGMGIGVEYSALRGRDEIVRGLGGHSSGPLELMKAVNETGRASKQGGDRRAAIWAGLNWRHPDCSAFIVCKNWDEHTVSRKAIDYNHPAPMDHTNISVGLDDQFFSAYHDPTHADHQLAHATYWQTVRQMLQTAEPGFSINVGRKADEVLRNAPVCAGTRVLTKGGYRLVGDIVNSPETVWTGRRWAEGVTFRRTGVNAQVVEVAMTGGRVIRCEPSHEFLVERWHGRGRRNRRLAGVDRVPAAELKPGDDLHVSLPAASVTDLCKNSYALGYLYGDGSFTQAGGAEVSVCHESKAACLSVIRDAAGLSSVTEKDARGYARCYFRVDRDRFAGRSKSEFPADLLGAGAAEACSFLAGLFDADGSADGVQQRIRLSSVHRGFLRDVARLLEQLGILAGVGKSSASGCGGRQSYQLVVMRDYAARFVELIPCQRLRLAPTALGYRKSQVKVVSVKAAGREDVFCCDVGHEEHSFMAEGVIISNCTEVVSRTNGTVCNLGSLNMARFSNLKEFRAAVRQATMFLLCGTVASDLPIDEMKLVRDVERRIGLGLMGLHEWLMVRGHRYGVCDELGEWLEAWRDESDDAASEWSERLRINRPIAVRAVAPTGTIAIVAETTSGIEPVLASAYKRRYFKRGDWAYQYVVDSAAKRVLDRGVRPELIEDAYDLASDSERRIAFQAFVQDFCDQSISSTVNLPAWGTADNCEGKVRQFGDALMKYLPRLRGITCYPDGCRGGQPLTKVPLSEAIANEGVEHIENGNQHACVSGVCGA